MLHIILKRVRIAVFATDLLKTQTGFHGERCRIGALSAGLDGVALRGGKVPIEESDCRLLGIAASPMWSGNPEAKLLLHANAADEPMTRPIDDEHGLFGRMVLCLAEPVSGHGKGKGPRSEEHTSELQSRENLVCRLLLEK